MNENKTRTYRVRLLVALGLMAVVAVGYFTAAGIGNFCGIGVESLTLLCPLGALATLLAGAVGVPVAVVSVLAALAVCLLLGKVFCAWACPVHFLSGKRRRRDLRAAAAGPGAATGGTADAAAGGPSAVDGDPAAAAAPLTARERRALTGCGGCATPCGKKEGVKLDSRHGILAAALGSTLVFGFPVFCLLCPVGLTFATVLLVMRLFAFGETTWTIIAFIAIIAAEVILLPRWCAKFCPLGALLSLMSAANRTFRPHLATERCLAETGRASCDACVRACPEGINLHDIATGETTLADCSRCRACADVCPAGAITFPLRAPKPPRAGAGAPRRDEQPAGDFDPDCDLAFAEGADTDR